MTRIPTATRRQHVEVRASQTAPKHPSLHALARHALPRCNTGPAKQCRAWLSRGRIECTTFHRQADGIPPGPQRPGVHRRRPMSVYDDEAPMTEATARIVDAGGDDDERRVEAALRPRRLSEFPGQTKVCDQLGLVLEAAKRRGTPP